MKQQLTSTPEGLPLDEDTFQHILAAAYVLQEEAGRARPKPPSRDHTQTLSEIVETQSLIHSQQLDAAAASILIAERVQKITHAAGSAVGIVEGNELVYCAATGSAAGEAGFRLPIDDSLSAPCLHSGQVLQSSDAEKDKRLSLRLCRERGVRSLIALPVYHEGKVAGVLELWFAQVNAFQEHDVRTCQLMAGLVAEAIARSAELEWKQALATERATMLEALEKLKPQLERLTVQSATAPAEPQTPAAPAEPPVEEPAVVQPEIESRVETICPGCGHQFEPQEFFCGICGTARLTEKPASDRLQSKWATLWHMQQAAEKKRNGTPAADSQLSADVAAAPPLEDAAADFLSVDFSAPDSAPELVPDSETDTVIEFPVIANQLSAPTAITDQISSQASPWSSAARARAWFESMKAQRPSGVWLDRQWRAHRANVYLVIAAILLLVVLSGWATHSAPTTISGSSVSAVNARRRKNPPRPQLTLLEKLLVGLGLAEAPPAPAYLGNPNTQVWVDLHTALYYCPGTDLYGKTPGGKFTSQHDAQQDQFEPAFRKPCD